MSKTVAKGARSSRKLLRTYLRTQIDELTMCEPGARIDSPNAVHRMRVACRRLRSSMVTFGPLFTGPKVQRSKNRGSKARRANARGSKTHRSKTQRAKTLRAKAKRSKARPSEAQRLRDELQWVGTVLGPVRDVEVLREHLHETAAILPVDADLIDVLAGLDHELAERHSHAHLNLIAAMNSPRYAALLAGLAAFVANPPWDAKAATRHTLPTLVGRACASVDCAAKAAEGALDLGGAELHEVRKAAKRARYAAEVAGLSAGPAAPALAGRMEELQELLGGHQDSLMARALLEDLADRMSERGAFALGLLTGVEHASDESVVTAYGLALAAASTDKVRGWTRQVKGHPSHHVR